MEAEPRYQLVAGIGQTRGVFVPVFEIFRLARERGEQRRRRMAGAIALLMLRSSCATSSLSRLTFAVWKGKATSLRVQWRQVMMEQTGGLRSGPVADELSEKLARYCFALYNGGRWFESSTDLWWHSQKPPSNWRTRAGGRPLQQHRHSGTSAGYQACGVMRESARRRRLGLDMHHEFASPGENKRRSRSPDQGCGDQRGGREGPKSGTHPWPLPLWMPLRAIFTCIPDESPSADTRRRGV